MAQNLYYTQASSSLELITELGEYSSWTDISSLITCGSLYQIIAFSGSTVVTTFPLFTTNLSYYPAYTYTGPTGSTPEPPTSPFTGSSRIVWYLAPNTITTSSLNSFKLYNDSVKTNTLTLATTSSVTFSSASLIPFTSPTGSFIVNGIIIAITGSTKPSNTSTTIFVSTGSSFAATLGNITASFNTSASNINYASALQYITSSTSGSPAAGLFFKSIPSTPAPLANNLYLTSGSTTTYFTGGTAVTASSLLVNTDTTYNQGSFSIPWYSNMSLILSGSGGILSNLNLTLTDVVSKLIIFSSSSYGTYLTSSFTSSNISNYEITASINSYPGILLTYSSSAVLPGTGSFTVDNWAIYSGLPISDVSYSGSNQVYLLGNDLANVTSIDISSQFNYKTTGFYSFGLTNLLNLTTEGTERISYPNISANPNLLNFTYAPQSNPEGYLIDISTNTELEQFIASNNLYISGSIPSLSSNTALRYYDVGNNKLSGSIPDLINNINLQYFDVSSNRLTGSIPNLSNNTNLQYFNVSNNIISGSIPNLSNNTNLTNFFCNINLGITGSIPTLPTSIVNFICSDTSITGPLPNLDNNTNLILFSAASCKISGSIPSLNNNTNLQYFSCGGNNLTGSIPSLTNNTSLNFVNVATNKLSGSIPNLSNNIALNQFYVHENYLTSYTSSGVSPTIQYFWAYDNLLDQTSVDNILYDLDNAGRTGGSVLLNGTNSAPSPEGYISALSLIDKGWTVNTVSMPSQSISIVTGSSNAFSYSFFSFGGDSGSIDYGQTFSMFENGILQNISLQLGRVNSPVFDLQLNLYDQLDGLPNNLLATSSNTIAASSLLNIATNPTGSLQTFTFDNYYLTGSASPTGSYVFGLTYVNITTHDDSNLVQIFQHSPGDYPYGYSVYKVQPSPNWFSSAADNKSIITYLV